MITVLIQVAVKKMFFNKNANMCLFPAFFCAYMAAAISKVMSMVSKKLSSWVKPDKRHLSNQMSLIWCVTLFPPMTSPFSLHYRPARGLSACRLSSSSLFPLRSQPSADCLFPWSPTPRRIDATRDSSRPQRKLSAVSRAAAKKRPGWWRIKVQMSSW